MTDLPFPAASDGPTPDVSVRPARSQDADSVVEVQLTAWRSGYADVLPELSQLDRDDMAEHWRASIAAPPTAHHIVLVALEAGAVVGVSVAGPLLDESGTPTAGAGEILDLLVHPEHTRSGHGSRLLAATVDRLRELGDREVLAWSGENDVARLSFLESAGFAADGVRRRLDMGAGSPALTELRLGALLD